MTATIAAGRYEVNFDALTLAPAADIPTAIADLMPQLMIDPISTATAAALLSAGKLDAETIEELSPIYPASAYIGADEIGIYENKWLDAHYEEVVKEFLTDYAAATGTISLKAGAMDHPDEVNKDETMKVGDIYFTKNNLYDLEGVNRPKITFYEVTKLTPKTVVFIRLTRDTMGGQNGVFYYPGEVKENATPQRAKRRPAGWTGHEWFGVNDLPTYRWDGYGIPAVQ